MWIKNMDGDYINSDQISVLWFDLNEYLTLATMASDANVPVARGNQTREIVTAIISGEKIMEVSE